MPAYGEHYAPGSQVTATSCGCEYRTGPDGIGFYNAAGYRIPDLAEQRAMKEQQYEAQRLAAEAAEAERRRQEEAYRQQCFQNAQTCYNEAQQWEAAARGECDPPSGGGNAPRYGILNGVCDLVNLWAANEDRKLQKQQEEFEENERQREERRRSLEEEKRRKQEEAERENREALENTKRSYNEAMYAGRTSNYQHMFYMLDKLWKSNVAMKHEEQSKDDNPILLSSNLGLCYYYGRGTTVNYDKAYDAFRRGSKLGQALSSFMLATMYEYGQGTEKDLLEALNLYTMAREQGYDSKKVSICVKRVFDDPDYDV